MTIHPSAVTPIAAPAAASAGGLRLLSHGKLLLGVLLLAGLSLRLYGLDSYSLWMDEVESIAMAQRGIAAIFTDRFGFYANQTPWHYLLVWLTIQPVDPATTSVLVRLPSALAGAALVWAVFALGREMFGPAAGWPAALLAAGSTSLLGVAQDARPYSLLALLTTLSVYCLLVARRTGRGRWWAAFAAVTIAGILNSYTALTLAIPALSLYWLWTLGHATAHRHGAPRQWRYVLLAFGAIALAALPALIELSRLDKTPPDFTQIRAMRGALGLLLRDWLAQANVPFHLSEPLQWALLLLAGLGFVAGMRGGRADRHGALISGSLLVLAPAELAVLSTTNTISARYVVFLLPCYYLLVSRGGLAVYGVARRNRVLAAVAGMAAMAVLGLFLAGSYRYYQPGGESATRYKPDYRAAAAYLAQRVSAADVVVFVDDPPHGVDVSRFYWQDRMAAQVYDGRDPRLAAYQPRGPVYWVIGFFYYDRDLQAALAAPAQGWAAVARFPGVIVARDPPGSATMIDRLDRLVGKLEALDQGDPAIGTLHASVYQDRGQVPAALAIYRGPAGHVGQLGAEHLQTAQGFARRGLTERAWQQAMLSKYNQAANPALHRWLAAALAATGATAASRTESDLAAGLAQRPEGR
jgi:4-amino-4-deoxy-L-arabinose transferase-like glycosyltransferase